MSLSSNNSLSDSEDRTKSTQSPEGVRNYEDALREVEGAREAIDTATHEPAAGQVPSNAKNSLGAMADAGALLDLLDSEVKEMADLGQVEAVSSVDQANAPRSRKHVLQKLSVLVPLYNERWTIERTLQRVLDANYSGLSLEIIVVDDGSTDGSYEHVQEIVGGEPKIRLFRHEKNRGKGAAIRTAIEHVSGDVVVIQDADLEYDPADIAGLLEPILSGDADAVFGSRFSSPRRRVLLFWNSLGNKLLTMACNALNNLNLTDMETCYKVVRADILQQLRLSANSFTFEPELTTRLAQWGARIYEVPISYRGRAKQDGKKTRLVDGIKAGLQLLKNRFFDTRFTRHDGMYILRSVECAKSYNRWIVNRVGKFMGRRVAEAGSGIGNLSQLLSQREHLFLVDHDSMYVAALEDRFQDRGNVKVHQCDLTDPGFEEQWMDERLDTVFCSNVLEHLGPHRAILKSFYRSIAPGGNCIIIVPAEPALYNGVDKSLGHHRRYRLGELFNLMQEAGFDVVHSEQVCKLGALAWWVNGKLGRTRLTPRQMRLFDLLWPIMNWADRFLPWRGMSLIMVGQRPKC
ncbi:MAG TPA: glycosyl transferase [Planctomycetaceae bacterium]|nr:glycosyl transferase [Planctomycetaceae bacterium]